MTKAGGGGLLVAGIFLVILGILIQSAIIEWLLDIIGFIVIVGGAIIGVTGLVKMVSGNRGGY
jgi:hypothetical protein